ncbi:MAG: 50S ribosomal protein L37e [Nanohaloarchaea archaeon]|nr:50S ribosomal protein L37e [Candidatus Nanohaloarchaea archaeon]
MGLNKGKRNKKTHGKCRRCGNKSFHLRKKECASCGFGKTKKMNKPEKKRKA